MITLRLLSILLVISSVLTAQTSEPHVVNVWPGAVPGEEAFDASKLTLPEPVNDGIERIPLVTEPTLTFYRAPSELNTGAAVLICPGGGYNILAWNLEGEELAAWFNRLGVSAGLLKYRVPRRDPDTPHEQPLKDAQRGLALMRANASAWGFDPDRVGMMGFSAGGHLVVMTAVSGAERTYPRQDDVDDLVRAPDFLMPIYPAYLGDERTAGELYPNIRVTPAFPPTFVAVTHDDVLRGLNAAKLYIALRTADVPAELHIYTRGGHGYGIRPSANPVSTWHLRLEEWLRAEGWLKKRG
jgi:acetyl esterase/lipase